MMQPERALLKMLTAPSVGHLRNRILHKLHTITSCHLRLCTRKVDQRYFRSTLVCQQVTSNSVHGLRSLRRNSSAAVSSWVLVRRRRDSDYCQSSFPRQQGERPSEYCSLPVGILSGLSSISRNASNQSSTPSQPEEGRSSDIESFEGKAEGKERPSYLEARMKGILPGRRILSATDRTQKLLSVDVDSEVSTEGISPSTAGNNLITPPMDSENEGQSRANTVVREMGGSDGGVTREERADPHDSPMVDGELVVAIKENFKRHEFMHRMFLLNVGRTFHSKYGAVLHADIVGHLAGTALGTDLGIEVMIRRPTLAEYVVGMRRTPVISYPKDCCAMLMMIDASPGDVVLEAGTGSGAMTLFLSRAVGSAGCIHTFDVKPEHQRRAIENVRQWRSSWNIGHPSIHWPDNVCFHSGKLQECHKHLESGLLVDGAIIDMERPHQALHILSARLKSGKAAAMYIANITQVMEVVEHLRIRNLPLIVEDTVEVTHRRWVVNQARRHSGKSLSEARLATNPEMHSDQIDTVDDQSSLSTQYIRDDVPKYLARPHNRQHGHTAFLVKLRKIGSASPTYTL